MATDAQLVELTKSKLSEVELTFDSIIQAIGAGGYEDYRRDRKEVRDGIARDIEQLRENYRVKVLYELLYRKAPASNRV